MVGDLACVNSSRIHIRNIYKMQTKQPLVFFGVNIVCERLHQDWTRKDSTTDPHKSCRFKCLESMNVP